VGIVRLIDAECWKLAQNCNYTIPVPNASSAKGSFNPLQNGARISIRRARHLHQRFGVLWSPDIDIVIEKGIYRAPIR
jgi:hypothetical protein